MDLRDVRRGEQVRYKTPIAVVKERLHWLGIQPETEVDVYPDYPQGWHAAVGANDRVYIFTCIWGHVYLGVQALLGYFPNGKLILLGYNHTADKHMLLKGETKNG